MKTFVSADTIADAVACLREAGTPLPANVADLDDVALGRALWRMNADALAVNHDEEIEGYAAPAASDSPAQRVKSLTHLMEQCNVDGVAGKRTLPDALRGDLDGHLQDDRRRRKRI